MFSLIKQAFMVLFVFGSSLATKCLSLNDEPCTVRPALIDLDPAGLKYYQFMNSLGKCSGSCNSSNDLSTKRCVPSKTKDINVKAINMITNRIETRTSVKHISCDYKLKFNSTAGNLNQKWNNKTWQCECKNYCTCKKDYSWNPTTYICENSKYLKITGDDSKRGYHEIIYVMDIVSIKMTNIVATNVSINSNDKKVKYKIDCYILHTVLLAIILLLIIAIIYYHYAKHNSKIKHILLS